MENGNKKDTYNQKETDEIFWTYIEVGGLRELNTHRKY